jgi:tetratricopeptide (TPR) repeat protein
MATTAETLALGLSSHQAGALDEAERLYRAAATADPWDAQPWFLLGVLYRGQGRDSEAAASYTEALRLRPEFVEARNNLGNALGGLGRWAEALPCYEQVLRQRPDYPEAHNNLGVAHRRLNRPDRAADCYREALRLRPHYAEAHNNLGDALQALDRDEEAAACYREALRLRPDHAEAHNNLGAALEKLGRPEEAAAEHREALRLRPGYVEAHSNLGNALLALRRYDEALACYREALRLRPAYPEGHYNMGLALAEQGKTEEAARCYGEALRLRPDYEAASQNLGNALIALGRTDEALAALDDILSHRPDAPEAHKSRGLALLGVGKFEEGWREYEWRWKTREVGGLPHAAPLWDGTPLNGRTILLCSEQGLGDTIQFARYAPLVKQRGGRVVLACPKALAPLLTTLPGVDQVVAGELPPFDCYAPLLNLPGLLGTTLDTIPADVPYLAAQPSLVQFWRRELAPVRGFKVGIAWQGSPRFKADRFRSVPLARFEALARVPGVELISLQKGPGVEQLPQVAGRFRILDLGDRLDERTGPFLDTAAVMKNLDLVVSSDTAVPHLAGALGVPVWVALPKAPDWRWLRDREDSPWYPTMRLFRQERWGDWESAFARMAGELERLASAPRRPGAVLVEVAPGELLDKLTILEIKAERLTDPDKLRHVRQELQVLAAARDEALPASPELARLTAELKEVNERLWEIEDEIRRCEASKSFGNRFIELARSVYQTNDHRAALKRRINELLGSPLIEEKSYARYD